MWILYLLIVIILIIVSPKYVSETSRLRYFACWASILLLTVIGSITVIIYALLTLQPRSCKHARIAIIAASFGQVFFDMEWELRDFHKIDIHEKFIAVLNHQSFLDSIVMLSLADKIEHIVVVSKQAIFYYWPLGLSLWMAETIFVNRTKKGEAYMSLFKKVRRHFQKHVGKRSVIIFPEGSRGEGKELKSFKTGAFMLAVDLKVPILPVVISPYTFMKYLEYFKTGKVVLKVLDPIPTADYTQDNLADLIEKTRNAMVREYEGLRREQEVDNKHDM